MAYDGTPFLLSSKIARNSYDALRLLVEPGSLEMTVAQQISFSLETLDRLLKLLSWCAAAGDINAITMRAFPPDPQATSGWWGGIWLGTSVRVSLIGNDSSADLRIYLNLRHGDAAERWQRVVTLLAYFACSTMRAYLTEWVETASQHSVPVGLGIVVARGRVAGMRIYLGVAEPDTTCLVATSGSAVSDLEALEQTLAGFVRNFGPMRPQSVTVGYDFVRDDAGFFRPTISRVKVDICCHLLPAERQGELETWTRQVFAAWPTGQETVEIFLEDVRAVWRASEIQFLSLGFAPELDHATIYVKPRTHPNG